MKAYDGSDVHEIIEDLEARLAVAEEERDISESDREDNLARAEAAEARLAAAENVVEAMGQSLRLVYESRWFGIEGFPTNEVRDALAAYDAHKKNTP